MLDLVAVAGYRSLRDFVLPLARLTVIAGANGTGKSNIYRALRLLGAAASNKVIGDLAREGGLGSVMWAGPDEISPRMRRGDVRVEGSRATRRPKRLRLGFSGAGLGYCLELGPPWSGAPTAFTLDPEIRRETIFSTDGGLPAALVDRRGGAVRVRDADGRWTELAALAASQTMLDELGDPISCPEIRLVRARALG